MDNSRTVPKAAEIMLNLVHRQPRVIVIIIALIVVGAAGGSAADATLDIERELAAAKTTASLLRSSGAGTEEWTKLKAIFREMAVRHPGDVRVLNACGALLCEQGDWDEADAFFHKAQALEPQNAEALSGLGASALAGGEVRKAAELYSKASAAAPASAPLHFDLANVLFLFRKELLDESLPDPDKVIAKALKHYAEACRLAPENVEFARGYAETFYGTPKPDWGAALEAWRHLHRISAKKDFALANMATVHLKLGQKTEARECVRQMNSPEFAARKARLAERIERE